MVKTRLTDNQKKGMAVLVAALSMGFVLGGIGGFIIEAIGDGIFGNGWGMAIHFIVIFLFLVPFAWAMERLERKTVVTSDKKD